MASSIEKGRAKLHMAMNMHFNVIKIVPWGLPHYQAQRESFGIFLSELLVKWLEVAWAGKDSPMPRIPATHCCCTWQQYPG